MNFNKALALAGMLISSVACAQTTVVSPNVYRIESGVTFTIGNMGGSDFLFNWIDKSGNFVNVVDPTLILSAGETYIFRRSTSSHPFIITDDTLEVTGTDGLYDRSTFDGAVLDAATLQPIADFTADPAPTSDQIEWSLTPSDVGDYFYTCRIFFHVGMVGRIEVVGAPSCPADLNGDGVVNFVDVSAFVALFGAGDLGADFNGDGVISFVDVSAFVAAFSAGCP